MLGHEPFDLRMNTDLFKTLSQDLTSVQLEKYSSLVNRSVEKLYTCKIKL